MKFLRKIELICGKPNVEVSEKQNWPSLVSASLVTGLINSEVFAAIKLTGPEPAVLQSASLYYKAFKALYPNQQLTYYSYTTKSHKFWLVLKKLTPLASPFTFNTLSAQKPLKSFLKSLLLFHQSPLPITLSSSLFTCDSSFILIPQLHLPKPPTDYSILSSFLSYSFQTTPSLPALTSYLYSFYSPLHEDVPKLPVQATVAFLQQNFKLKLFDTGPITSLAISSNFATIATGGLDGRVRLWDFEKNIEICVIKPHKRAVYHLTFTPNSSVLVSGGNDQNIGILTLGKRKRIYKKKAHEQYMNCLSVTPDSRMAVSGGDDGVVQLWDLKDCCLLSSLKGHTSNWRHCLNVIACDVSQEANIAVTGGSDGYVRIWRLEWRCLEGAITSHQSLVPYVPQLNPFNIPMVFEDRFYEGVTSVKFFQSSKFFISGGEDGYVRKWDLMMKEKIWETNVHRGGRFDGVKVLEICKSDLWLASGGCDGVVAILDGETGILKAKLEVHEKTVTCLSVTLNIQYLVSGGEDLKIGVIDLTTMELVKYTGCHTNTILGLRPVNSGILSFGLDGNAKLWDLPGMKLKFQIQGHVGVITAVLVNSFLGEIVTGGFSGAIRFWKVGSQKSGVERIGHKGWVSFFALGPLGRFFVSGGADGVLKVWESALKRVVRKVKCGECALVDILVAKNGEGLIAASQDNKIFFWEFSGEVEEIQRFGRFLEVKRKYLEFRKFFEYLNC